MCVPCAKNQIYDGMIQTQSFFLLLLLFLSYSLVPHLDFLVMIEQCRIINLNNQLQDIYTHQLHPISQNHDLRLFALLESIPSFIMDAGKNNQQTVAGNDHFKH